MGEKPVKNGAGQLSLDEEAKKEAWREHYEWLVRLVQSMYKDVRSRVRVGDGYSGEFGVGVGVHQGSVLSPLLFIIVLEALSREFRTGCPWELLYADDMISAESMEELLVKVQTRKTEMEKKGLRVNMGKTKIMESALIWTC